MVGVRRFADGRCEAAPAHLLLELLDGDAADAGEVVDEWVAQVGDAGPVEAFINDEFGTPTLERAKVEIEERFGERQKQLQAALGLYEAELLERRRRLKDAVAKGEPAAKTKLAACEEDLKNLVARRAAAESALLVEIDSMRLGPVTIYARALVVPVPPEQADRRRDPVIEAIAVRVAREHDLKYGAVVEDVSDPLKKMGFDLKSTPGTVRWNRRAEIVR